MKNPLSNKYRIIAALIIAFALTSNISAIYAGFSDRDSKDAVTARMATVDVELTEQSFERIDADNGVAYFSITNKSNIDIYLRVGVTFELTDEYGKPVIADTGNIIIFTGGTTGWEAEDKTWTVGNATFSKLFLIYSVDSSYIAIKPGENMQLMFGVNGIPEGCNLTINFVPEAVQADKDGKALEYLHESGKVIPAW